METFISVAVAVSFVNVSVVVTAWAAMVRGVIRENEATREEREFMNAPEHQFEVATS